MGRQENFFLEATEKRQKEGEQAMNNWKQIHAINELKREEQFRNMRHGHAKAFASMCQRHAFEFRESQQQRVKEFGANEQQREWEFVENEKTRETLFKEAQNSREKQFSRVMEDYMATARKDEVERETLFACWELSVQTQFGKMLNEWKQGFAAVEIDRRRGESVFIQNRGGQSSREMGPLHNGADSGAAYDKEELMERDDWMDAFLRRHSMDDLNV